MATDNLIANIAKLSAKIVADQSLSRALSPFSARAERDEAIAQIGRDKARLETMCSKLAKIESARAGFPCTPVQGVKVGGGW